MVECFIKIDDNKKKYRLVYDLFFTSILIIFQNRNFTNKRLHEKFNKIIYKFKSAFFLFTSLLLNLKEFFQLYFLFLDPLLVVLIKRKLTIYYFFLMYNVVKYHLESLLVH
jgi:hypothetical protein